MLIDISQVSEAFPDFRVAVIVVENLNIWHRRDPTADDEVTIREVRCREAWLGTPLSEIPGIAVWRTAYKAFGIRKTSYRSAVERLVKNALAGRDLPSINTFVDLYNAVSLAHVFPIGADDLDNIVGDIAFRRARRNDSFLDMSSRDDQGNPHPDPPKDNEIVYADQEKVLCRRWNWRQDARSLVLPTTKRAIVTIQSNGAGDLDAAVADFKELVERCCGAKARIAVADRLFPVATLP